MVTDVSRTIGAVAREITTREVNGATMRVLVVSRSYDTTPDDLWDALTNAERIPRWFMPISGDLRPGGRYQLEGNAGGEILECEPPTSLGITWEYGGQVSWVNVRLSGEGNDATHLRLEHVAPVDDGMWEQFGPGAVGIGWDMALFGLDQHFASGATVTPENAMEWMASEEGIDFMRRSSDAWRDASIAAGTDESTAAAAAERTLQAYTGQGEGSGSA